MNARLLFVASVLLMMGSGPCGGPQPVSTVCPPEQITIVTADAGEAVADAGNETTPTEPIPSFGEQELGMLHNAALLVIQQKINDGDIVPGEDLASNISQYSNAVRDWICELGYDCRTVDQVRGEVVKELYKAVQAIPEGGNLSDGLRRHLPTMEQLPDWFATDLEAAMTSFEAGEGAVERARAAYANVGRGRDVHDGGNYGRIARSVSKGSWNYWKMPNRGVDDDVHANEIVYADCAGAGSGAAMGSGFPPWGSLIGGVIGGAIASAAASRL